MLVQQARQADRPRRHGELRIAVGRQVTRDTLGTRRTPNRSKAYPFGSTDVRMEWGANSEGMRLRVVTTQECEASSSHCVPSVSAPRSVTLLPARVLISTQRPLLALATSCSTGFLRTLS